MEENKLININLNQTISRFELLEIQKENNRWIIFYTLIGLFVFILGFNLFILNRYNDLIVSRIAKADELLYDANEIRKKYESYDIDVSISQSDIDKLYDAIKELADADGEEEKEDYTNALKSKKANKSLERGEKFSINQKDTLTNLYKSLDKKEVSGITKDTQNLIETQKKLIETLNVMGPSLKQSKDILDTFKDYFGDDLKF